MGKPSDPRSLALSVLDALERRDAFAEALLDGFLARAPDLAPRDRALASHIVYGVLRWRNRLDAYLARASSRPLERVHPRLLQILRIGAYQLLFLDRVPNHAAVDRSVALARTSGLRHASGFVNAVLRKVAGASEDLPLPADPVGRFSLLFGCPTWLVETWLEEHGPEGAEALCHAASRIPTLWLRVLTRRISRREALERLRQAGVEAEEGHHGPEAVRLAASGDPRDLPLVAEGLALVQDQGSQLVAHLAAPPAGARVLDACGAPGLKATHLAELAGEGAEVLALDVHPHRVRRIEELAARLGDARVRVETVDAREYRSDEPFDVVLVDAPCSGLGVLDRTPEAKWRRSREDLAGFPPLQRALLGNLAHAVRPGGVLVYATCTTVRAENEGVVEHFLASRDDFVLEPPPPGSARWDGLVAGPGYLRTFPAPAALEGPRALDGFFGARLRRNGAR